MAHDLTLVLGGTGFLGVHVVEAALAAGDRVLSAARGAFAHPSAVRSAGVDLGAGGALEELLERERPARVILCAAMARAVDCERDPRGAERMNAELPARVGRWCRASGARLVHVSTDLVFGADGPPPPTGFREEDPVAPAHAYGETKVAGERALLAEFSQALVVRLPLLYGDSRGRGLGASDVLLAAVERGEHPTLFVDEWRTPLEVSDAARALVELASTDVAGLLHVAGPDRLTRHALGCATLRARGRSEQELAELVHAGVRADAGMESSRAADASLDSTRALALLVTELRSVGAGLDRAPPRG